MGRGEEGVAASVRQRLLRVAQLRGEDFERVLVGFVAERFLYRLARSRYVEAFVLKGAMLFVAWERMPHRATRDIDLLGLKGWTGTNLIDVFREVAGVCWDEDPVVFDVDGIAVESIRPMSERGGTRVSLRASVGRARVSLQVDVGFGDAVTPGPELIDFPSLLGGPSAKLRGYPVETVVAEKTLAVVERGLLNSRMKDYFDLLHLARSRAFDGRTLVAALAATARARGVTVGVGDVPGLGPGFSDDPVKRAQWAAFCRRMRREGPVDSLGDVVETLRRFLGPVIDAVARGRSGSGRWIPGGPWRGGPGRRPSG